MTTDLIFPIYTILVDLIFGSVALALVGVYMILIAILALCRCSWVFMIYWTIFYVAVMFTFYLGGIGLLIVFILALFYLITQIVRYAFPLS